MQDTEILELKSKAFDLIMKIDLCQKDMQELQKELTETVVNIQKLQERKL